MTDILFTVDDLLAENRDAEIAISSTRDTAVHCLLSLPVEESTVVNYYKKYSVVSEGYVRPLFPLVLIPFRHIFWDDVVKYNEENKGSILKVCVKENTTNDVRGSSLIV